MVICKAMQVDVNILLIVWFFTISTHLIIIISGPVDIVDHFLKGAGIG